MPGARSPSPRKHGNLLQEVHACTDKVRAIMFPTQPKLCPMTFAKCFAFKQIAHSLCCQTGCLWPNLMWMSGFTFLSQNESNAHFLAKSHLGEHCGLSSRSSHRALNSWFDSTVDLFSCTHRVPPSAKSGEESRPHPMTQCHPVRLTLLANFLAGLPACLQSPHHQNG